MEKIVTKMYQGMVEVRDYEVEQCIRRGENMTIRYKSDIMTLTPEELTSKCTSISNTIYSRIPGGKDYKLHGYDWNPISEDY